MSKGKQLFADMNKKQVEELIEKNRKARQELQTPKQNPRKCEMFQSPVKLNDILRLKTEQLEQNSQRSVWNFIKDGPGSPLIGRSQQNTDNGNRKSGYNKKMHELKQFVKANINSQRSYESFMILLSELDHLAAQKYGSLVSRKSPIDLSQTEIQTSRSLLNLQIPKKYSKFETIKTLDTPTKGSSQKIPEPNSATEREARWNYLNISE